MAIKTPDQKDPVSSDRNTASGDGHHDSVNRVSQLLEYVSYYLHTQKDALMSGLRTTAMVAAFLLVALVACAAIIVSGVVQICFGLSGALGALFGNLWLGNLIVGVGLLLFILGGLWIGTGMLRKSWHTQTVKKYELRQAKQRAKYGKSVADDTDARIGKN